MNLEFWRKPRISLTHLLALFSLKPDDRIDKAYERLREASNLENENIKAFRKRKGS